MKVGGIFLLALFLLGGCTESAENPLEGSPEQSQVPPSSPAGHERIANVTSNPVSEFNLIDCVRLHHFVVYPLGVGAPEVPEVPQGWERNAPIRLFMQAVIVECARVEWLNFSRGPITFLYDQHDKIRAPPGCAEDYSHLNIRYLGKLLVSDSDVAQALSKMGAPTEYREFEPLGTTGIPVHAQVSWQDVQGQSSINFVALEQNDSTDSMMNFLHIWPRSDGWGTLELSLGSAARLDGRVSVAELADQYFVNSGPSGEVPVRGADITLRHDQHGVLNEKVELSCDE